jgi:uncharacterized protein (DUF433 family)
MNILNHESATRDNLLYHLYGGLHPREVPVYSITEVAHHLHIPLNTVRSWVRGRNYPTEQGLKFFEPLVKMPDQSGGRLSFVNLIEIHVLAAIRQDHDVRIPKIRKVIDFMETHFRSAHPLADEDFSTDGIDLFLMKYGEYMNASDGQMAMKRMLELFLKRIDRDPSGAVARLYPFVDRTDLINRSIEINPLRSFGRPVLAGTALPTIVLAERYLAGDSIDVLAKDYEKDPGEIEKALIYERVA